MALQRNRDVIAARLDIDASELDVVAARIYPNPTFEYAIGNLVLGTPNPQSGGVPPSLGLLRAAGADRSVSARSSTSG